MDEQFRKAYEASIDDIDPKNREVVAIISTDGVDREKDVLLPKGLRRKNYAGMTIDFNHNKDLPIGVSKWVKAESNRVISKYRVSDKTEFSRDVFNLLQDGVLRFHSVDGKSYAAGKPTSDEMRIHKDWGGADRIIRDWEMFNFTVCTVPQNDGAVALMVAKGYNPTTIEAIAGKAIADKPPPVAAKKIIEDSGLRVLTTGEAFVAMSKAMTARAEAIDINKLIEKAIRRAGGRLD